MGYKELYASYRQEVEERYPLVMGRIKEIVTEETTKEPFRSYFQKVAAYIVKMYEAECKVEAGTFLTQSLEELQAWNQEMYADVLPENYGESYANPAYAIKTLGEEYGKILCKLYDDIRGLTKYVVEENIYELTIYGEMFVEIYNCFEDELGTSPEEIKKIIYWFNHDYSEIFVERNVVSQVSGEDDYYINLLNNADFTDLRYLYGYGQHIGENEIKVAQFMNQMPEEKIQAMADTYTEGFRMGFVNARIDLTKKTVVELIYPIGFERMMRAAVANFEKLGLKSITRRGKGRGPYAVPVNEQYDFDHKDDAALYLDKAYVERRLECFRTSYENHKEAAAGYAGPAVVEVFGTVPFAPESKPENWEYNEKQQELNVYFSSMAGQIVNQYIKGDEYSFTIIAYPLPAIGEQFEEIFEKTVELNNLDYKLYQGMQQKMIDVLDQGEYVHILGKGENRTDLTVAIQPIADPTKETAFENCVADVNIPVGEVFTSPQLKGTNGILHVTEVFLNSLKYIDLELKFEDGMITSYTCKNFESEEENQKFLKTNLLFHHDTLPMGEFAIGTNTTAYKMGRDYNIADKLPILIAEKTGPHFAVGDTCFSWAEDVVTFNPDGKQIIAKENEVSALRKEDLQKAYLNCHTDITIPYDELDKITVITKTGERLPIIDDGKFVVPGTEELNIPLM